MTAYLDIDIFNVLKIMCFALMTTSIAEGTTPLLLTLLPSQISYGAPSNHVLDDLPQGWLQDAKEEHKDDGREDQEDEGLACRISGEYQAHEEDRLTWGPAEGPKPEDDR